MRATEIAEIAVGTILGSLLGSAVALVVNIAWILATAHQVHP